MKKKSTDWDEYYHQSVGLSSFTRRITFFRLYNWLYPYLKGGSVRMCELGGGNSCFVRDFLASGLIEQYHIIDTNQVGLNLLKDRLGGDSRVTCSNSDATALSPSKKKFNICFSVGLIEHFDEIGTSSCLKGHFEMCDSDGVVLVTFPTPTFLYQVIRTCAEKLGCWKFHDERPLSFEEVESVIEKNGGNIVRRGVNWWIGLTQGYILFELCDKKCL